MMQLPYLITLVMVRLSNGFFGFYCGKRSFLVTSSGMQNLVVSSMELWFFLSRRFSELSQRLLFFSSLSDYLCHQNQFFYGFM